MDRVKQIGLKIISLRLKVINKNSRHLFVVRGCMLHHVMQFLTVVHFPGSFPERSIIMHFAKLKDRKFSCCFFLR